MSTLEGLTVYDDVRMAKLMHRSMSCPLHADLMKNLRKIICQKWGERYSHVLSNTVYDLIVLSCTITMLPYNVRWCMLVNGASTTIIYLFTAGTTASRASQW